MKSSSCAGIPRLDRTRTLYLLKLDGDDAVEEGIARPPDFAEPALAEQVDHLVLADAAHGRDCIMGAPRGEAVRSSVSLAGEGPAVHPSGFRTPWNTKEL